MAIKTERSSLIKKKEKKSGDDYCILEEAGDEEDDVCTAEDRLLEEGSREDYAPNGGWGWIVTLAAFVIWLLNGSCSAVFGVLFSGFLTDHGASSSTTAWIQNLTFVLSNFCSYLLDPLVGEFGWRPVGIAMGLMNGCGLALSAFATSPAYLFFSYTVVAGIPVDILLTLTFAIVPHYFTTKRTIANSLMTTGSSFSIIVMPMIVTYLLDQYGFRHATLTTAALYFNSCVAAMVFHPVEWHAKQRQHRRKVIEVTEKSTYSPLRKVAVSAINNLGHLKSGRVIVIGTVLGINVMGLFNFYYLVPFTMKAAGYTVEEVGMCLIVSGITVLITRFVQPLLIMWTGITHKTGLMVGSSIIATSITAFAWSETLAMKMTSMGTFGVGYGFFFTSYNLVMVEVLGLPMLQPMLSVTGLFKSTCFLTLGPMIGSVRDMSDSFPVCLTLLAIFEYVSVAIWLFLPAARRYDQRKAEQELQQ
ncbi:monocarboxylate transporter 4-like isoform X2 [Eriocheir sinensis]|nr:monocarboxylate transporter 4-like isoform X2 [Eriocheir sinensis]